MTEELNKLTYREAFSTKGIVLFEHIRNRIRRPKNKECKGKLNYEINSIFSQRVLNALNKWQEL